MYLNKIQPCTKMNLGSDVSCGTITPTQIGLSDKKVQNVIATTVKTDSLLAAEDETVDHVLGRAAVGGRDDPSTTDTWARLSHYAQRNTTNMIGQNQNGHVLISAPTGQTVDINVNNFNKMTFFETATLLSSPLQMMPVGSMDASATILRDGTITATSLGINTTPTVDLDVTGDMVLDGRLGYTENGAVNYGTAGAVLTSNGATESVSWTAPVYVSARKNSDTNVTVPSASTTFEDVDGMTIELSSGNVYNTTTGEFTAPRTAIYIIDYAVNIFEAAADYTHYLSSVVSVNRGSGFVREMSQTYSDLSQDTQLVTLKVTYMTELNENDVVKNEVEFYHVNGTTATIRGHATTSRCTFQIIRSIT